MRFALIRLLVGSSCVALAVLFAASPAAAAGTPTTIEFAGTTAVEADFGSSWTLQLIVSTQYPDGPTLRVGSEEGSVDIYVTGVGEAFASDLAIQPDGTVYVSQPLEQPLLAAGDYQVSAIYNPAPGGYLSSSQTTVPASLTIVPLTLSPGIELTNDRAVSPFPVISASLTGSYVEINGGAPAGTWEFTVVEHGMDEPIFTAQIAQSNGSTEPVRVEIDSRLTDSTEYTVTTAFTPVDELAGGIAVATAPTASFTTPGTTLIDALSSRLPFPWWVVLAVGVLLMGLVTTVIVLSVKLSRRPEARTDSPRLPGEPAHVEDLSWEEAGIAKDRTQPLPESTNWLLSDIEPGVNEGDSTNHANAATDPAEPQGPVDQAPTKQP